MKKLLISMLLAILLLPLASQAQTHYNVSVGSGTSTNEYVPDHTYYSYSLVQTIYPANEVGIAGVIDTLSFQVNDYGATRNVAIYMAEVTTSPFSYSSGPTLHSPLPLPTATLAI